MSGFSGCKIQGRGRERAEGEARRVGEGGREGREAERRGEIDPGKNK